MIPSALVFRLDYDISAILPGALRITTTAAHVLFSYIAFLIIGALLFIHVRLGLRKKKSIVTGMSLLFLFVILCFSGIGLFYLANENLIKVSSVAHIGLGLVFFVMYLIHLTKN